MPTMRAFVLLGPRTFEVQEVEAPFALPGDVVADVERVGLCGTDVEFFTGQMAYLDEGYAHYPMRLGHEWCGTVREIGDGVDESWLGRRVTGDTMLGCGACRRCLRGRQHLCGSRGELGVRDGRPGALAEQVAVPVTSLHALPDELDDQLGALVEPGGNALRAADASGAGPGDRVLVTGPGTIGSLVCLFLRARGAEVHVLGAERSSLEFVAGLGLSNTWTARTLPDLPFDAVVECSNAEHLPALALERVEPGGRVVYIGLSGQASTIDTRTMALKDVTCTGVLSASPGLEATVRAYATGTVDPRPLVAATVGLEDVGAVLDGWRPPGAGAGPKIHVDPRPSRSERHD